MGGSTDPAARELHVAAGVIRNDDGRVLIAQRPEGSHLAGGWEFPGGKVAAGETALQALRKAVSKNPHMKIYIASGFYDLATPYFATEYTLDHMGLDPTLRPLFETGEFEAGHMMYIHTPSLEKLKADIGRFVG